MVAYYVKVLWSLSIPGTTKPQETGSHVGTEPWQEQVNNTGSIPAGMSFSIPMKVIFKITLKGALLL